MARLNINVGTNANDGTGDDLRTAMQKINENFTEVYAGTLAATTLEFSNNNIVALGTNDSINLVPNGTGKIVFPAISINNNNIEGLRSNDAIKIIPNGSGTIELQANTNITGTLNAAGAATLGTSLTLSAGATITEFATSTALGASDTKVPTQNAVKAYVDAQIVATNTLKVADDSSTVIDMNLDATLSVIGATGISTAVSGSTLTITGPNLSSYLTNSAITVVGDDSTGTTLNTGETIKIAGTSGVSTAVSGDTLTITGPDLSSYLQNTGTQTIDNLTFNDNIISASSNADLILQANGTGLVSTSSLFVNDDNIIIARRWNDDSTRTSSVGKSGDEVGMIAWEDDHVYVCTANYDGSTQIWRRAAISAF